MRKLFEPQIDLDFSIPTRSKEIKAYEERYSRISKILDSNPVLLKIVGKKLSYDKALRIGREGYTVEQALRSIILLRLEGFSYRDASIKVHFDHCLRKFCRLGNRPMMSFSELARLDQRICPDTWEAITQTLNQYAVSESLITGKKLRSDTTAVETNIHYPTDSHLLWDLYRSYSRLIKAARKLIPERIGDIRAHQKRYKTIYFQINRTVGKKNKEDEIKGLYRRLIGGCEKILSSASEVIEIVREEIVAHPLSDRTLKLQALLSRYEYRNIPAQTIIGQATRRVIHGEKVPNDEKIFSFFEPHTELLKRGKAGKPIEFGHMILLNQVEGRYITGSRVFSKKPNENEWVDKLLSEHKQLFGKAPEVFAADKGFYAGMKKIGTLEEEIGVVAIGKKGRLAPSEKERESTEAFKEGGYFRAGIEGTISVLKRAFKMGRCLSKGFERFRSFVLSVIFAHNLRILSQIG